jgi:arylsulfatase A-like enzyme
MTDYSVLFISVDSLTRKFLGCYPGEVEFDVETDNLDRFAERAAVFDTHYAGSLPCMPARREWSTGTQEFLWRPWGPVEPFDSTLPELARHDGVLTQLVTDHYHYFQHGSHGYYEDFNAFEFVRGHEFDAWQSTPRFPDEDRIAQSTVGEGAPDAHQTPPDPEDLGFMNRAQYARNVADFEDETDFFAPRVFSRTAEWIGENDEWDQWFCYVDSFDVHEPFHCPEPYASMYTDEDPADTDLVDWPYYGRTDEGQSELTDRQLEFVRAQFAGKVTMVDRWFGRVLDALDETDAWEDTVVVVTSDHGHYLGEHGWVGKPDAPLYDVLAHTPLLVSHPDGRDDRVDALTSAVDLYGTVLDHLGVEADHRHSRSLAGLVRGGRDEHRDWALYGYWGSSVNVTDGRHTYLRACDPDHDVGCYSTEMTSPYGWFQPREHQRDAEPASVPYADGPVWRYPAPGHSRHDDHLLFDTEADPEQQAPLDDGPEAELCDLLVEALDALEAPAGQYDRLGLQRAD